MIFEKSCGGIIYKKEKKIVQILLVKHTNGGHWSFPKGHVEDGETEIETALREIKEETNLDVKINEKYRYSIFYSPKKEVEKEVVYFLCEFEYGEIYKQEEEILDILWVDINDAHSYFIYKNDIEILEKVKDIIL